MSKNHQICFVLLPGFAPDNYPVLAFKSELEKMGHFAVAANFWGIDEVKDFSKLTSEDCRRGVSALINDLSQKFEVVIGVGISLGGAFLMEYAKNNDGLDYVISIGTPFKLRKRGLISVGFIGLPILNAIWSILYKFTSWRLLPIGASKMVAEYLEGDFLKNLEKMNTPVLLTQSKNDGVTDYRVLEKFIAKFPNSRKKIVYMKNTDHVIGYDVKIIMEQLQNFVGPDVMNISRSDFLKGEGALKTRAQIVD